MHGHLKKLKIPKRTNKKGMEGISPQSLNRYSNRLKWTRRTITLQCHLPHYQVGRQQIFNIYSNALEYEGSKACSASTSMAQPPAFCIINTEKLHLGLKADKAPQKICLIIDMDIKNISTKPIEVQHLDFCNSMERQSGLSTTFWPIDLKRIATHFQIL